MIDLVSRVIRRVRALKNGPEKPVLHFLHIGKTGGTAVKQALLEHATIHRYTIHLHEHAVSLKDVPVGEGVIFCLRDPVSRFVSGFYSRQRQGQPRFLSPWSIEEQEAFDAFKTPNALALSLCSLDEEAKRKGESAMKNIQHVRASYWEWFENESYFRSRASDIFFIGFQESLHKDFQVLRSKLCLPESVKLPDDDIQSHKNPAHVDKTLDDKAVARLRAWYADDYRFLDLAREMVEQRGLGVLSVR